MYLCEVINDMHQGINTVADKVEYHEAGIPIIQSKNFTKGFLDLDDVRYLGPEDEEKYSLKYNPHVGDILMANIGTIGKSYVIKEEQRFLIAWNAFLIKPKREYVISEFLKYYFDYLATSKYFDKLLTGGTVKFINKKKIGEILVPECSMDEQMNIVQILSKVEQVIIKRQSQLEELDNLIKSRFVEMFGDLVLGDKFSDVKQKVGDIAYVTKLAGFEFTKFIQYKEQGDIIMLRGLNCKKGHLVLDDIKWIDRETSDMLPRSKLYYGDILMTYAGTIGDVAMVDEDDKYHLAPNVAKITLHDKKMCNPVFLIHLFMYSHDYIMTFASQVAQASINMEKIRSFEYYFPPIDLQNEFERFVSQIDKLKFEVQKSLDETQTLMDSLMQQYFG